MKHLKCPCCGAPLKNTNTYCEYCGSYFSDDDKNTSTTDSFKDIGNNVLDSVKHISANIKKEVKQMSDRHFNVFLFIFLCIFFFPGFPIGGLLYLLSYFKNK